MTIFHQILGKDIAVNAMVTFLKRWLPIYIAEVDRQRGITDPLTSKPKSFQKVPVFDDTLDGQLPAMLVICPGTTDKPHKLGDGSYVVSYTIGIAALIKGPDQDTSDDIAGRYGAAIAACVEQKAGLEIENVEGISWEGDSYDSVPVQSDRTLTSAVVHFNVEMRGVLKAHDAGPPANVYPEPPEDPTTPYPDWGKIPDEDHIVVTIVKEKP